MFFILKYTKKVIVTFYLRYVQYMYKVLYLQIYRTVIQKNTSFT